MAHLSRSDQMADCTGVVLAHHIVAILQSVQTCAQQFAHDRCHLFVETQRNLKYKDN